MIQPRTARSPFAEVRGESVSWGQFLAEAHTLASELPDGRYAINLCEDRYNFCLGWVASLISGKVTLLPPDRSYRHLQRIERDYPAALILNDQPGEVSGCNRRVSRPQGVSPIDQDRLQINPDQLAVIAFTSGTTGEPQAHAKSWAALCSSAGLINQHLGGVMGCSILATVPSQHMYGLELGILLPLCCGAVLHSAKPFFPADIAAALATADQARVLVTTPIHLRSLIHSELSLPRLDRVVSATAPLDISLARTCEERFQAPLLEIYGCTEAGSIAGRRPVEEACWTLFEPLTLVQEQGQLPRVLGPYLPEPVVLNDLLDEVDGRRFHLVDRSPDLINIAGKRTSLSALNEILLGIRGVVDGAFFLPDEPDMAGTPRLIAFAVAPGLSGAAILEKLRAELDSAFVPRTVHRLDALPRNDTGKLPRERLQDLLGKPGSEAR